MLRLYSRWHVHVSKMHTSARVRACLHVHVPQHAQSQWHLRARDCVPSWQAQTWEVYVASDTSMGWGMPLYRLGRRKGVLQTTHHMATCRSSEKTISSHRSPGAVDSHTSYPGWAITSKTKLLVDIPVSRLCTT